MRPTLRSGAITLLLAACAALPLGAAQAPLVDGIPHCIGPTQTVAFGTTRVAMPGEVYDCVEVAGRFIVPPWVSIRVTTILTLPLSYYEHSGEVITRDVPPADGQFHTGLLLLGQVVMQGEPVETPWVTADREYRSGDTLAALAASAGWAATDRLVMPDTRHLRGSELGSAFTLQAETLTSQQPLIYDHLGARDRSGALRTLPHVANLTRTCVVRSENPNGTRGHVLISSTAMATVDFCHFKDVGRTTTAALGPMNPAKAYALHLHHHRGPSRPGFPASPSMDDVIAAPQFVVRGNVFEGSPKWGLAIHDTHYGLIEDNILIRNRGAGIMLEDGSESYNVIRRNLAIDTTGVGGRDAGGTEGVAFYARGPNNWWIDNVAANAYQASANESAYGFKIILGPTFGSSFLGSVRLPAYPGADPMVDGATVNSHNLPLRGFTGNTVYASSNGITFWWLGMEYETPRAMADSVFLDTTIWHTVNASIYAYHSNRVVFDGLRILGGGTPASAGCCGQGIRTQDYPQSQLTIRNADIQNLRVGIQLPAFVKGTVTIEDATFNNDVNLLLTSPWHSALGSRLTPRDVLLRNVWATGSAPLLTRQFDGPSYKNFRIPDTLTLVNPNGVGRTYRGYWHEQVAGHTMPATNGNTVGCPTSGLTNAECLAQYGVTTGGAIAPDTATTLVGVQGLVVETGAPPPPPPPPPPPADTDGDGVTDDIDACPQEPGPASNNGCPVPPPPPPDSDGDGVPDVDDVCPDVAGTEPNGCLPPPPPPPVDPCVAEPVRITRVRGWPGSGSGIRPWIEWDGPAALVSFVVDAGLTRMTITDTRGCSASVVR